MDITAVQGKAVGQFLRL